MLFSITRFGLAAASPALIFGQQVTYTFDISGTQHSLVVPTPPISTTTVTPAAVTVTSASVETHVYTVTGPANGVSQVPGKLPESVGIAGSVVAGAIIPLTIHGYETTITLPSSASVPTGEVTLSPVHVIAATPATAAAGTKEVTSETVPASQNGASAASHEVVIASNVAGSTGSAIEPATERAASQTTIPTHVPIPVVPLSAASASAASAAEAASTAGSSAAAGASREASRAIASASVTASEAAASASTIASVAASRAESARSAASTALASTRLSVTGVTSTVVSSSVGITTDSSSQPSTSTTTEASTSTSTSTSTSESSSSSSPPPSSSSPSSSPSASSTKAPTSGASTAVVGGIVWVLAGAVAVLTI